MKSFNTFLLLLGLLVVITIVMALYKKWSEKETFVNFQNQPSAGTTVYIPQYSSNPSKTVLSLYDNLYFDSANGSLIEVFAPHCDSGCDTTGQNITEITVASRDGTELTSISTNLDNKGHVIPYASPQSQVSTLSQIYNQFLYTTSCNTTAIYQIIYVSWYTDTYLHIIDLSATTQAGTNLKTIHMNSQGMVDSQSNFAATTLAPYSANASMSLPNNLSILGTTTDPVYTPTLTILGTDSHNNSILYDIANGNIVLKVSVPVSTSQSHQSTTSATYTAYNRNGTTVTISKPATSWNSLSTTSTFVINDIPNVSVIVSAYKNDTIITILVPTNTKIYKLLYTFRFNKTGYVYNGSTDLENTIVTPAPTTKSPHGLGDIPETTIPPHGSSTGNSDVCGDDLSCKWYWYFNTIAQNKDGNSFLSDDYFLKTEAIPPVCPQCPQCPSSGACSNCGGNGGSGTSVSKPPASSLPPGAITGAGGNVYIPYTDSSGNVRYVLYSASSKSGGSSSQSGSKPDNLTAVDQNGQFVTTADPNTLGGGLAVSTMSLDQLGTSGFNNAASLGNNIVNTAGNVVGGTVNAATGLVGGVANTAANLVGGTVNAATGLVGGTIATAADLAKDAGSGLFGMGGYGPDGMGGYGHIRTGQMSGTSGTVNQGNTSSLGYSPISDKTFGNTGLNTPVDNYSYYGAVQSKGGNYMPITADFSAFSK